eukprot:TRINITY_DN59860_c0_g1_i1.p1 TRINITY_DN59860_c0_g1~~TRINITY_DN59860_c0_g1_i1.p1  ORF type:complete len:360 (-),score=33.90 TRINITY_DN59860_c0_g1_i1:120-1199(-)
MQGFTEREKQKLLIMAGFSLINGWVDAICYFRYKCFATMMVGNMLMLGHKSATYHLDGESDPSFGMPAPLFYFLLILCFMSGVLLYRLLERALNVPAEHLAWVVMVSLVLHDILEVMFGFEDSKPHRWNVMLLAPAFGMQDAACIKSGFGTVPWCTTNNLVTIAFGTADVIIGGATQEEKLKMLTSFVMMIAMTGGALLGACCEWWAQRQHLFPGSVHDYGDYSIIVVAPFLGVLLYINARFFKPKPAPRLTQVLSGRTVTTAHSIELPEREFATMPLSTESLRKHRTTLARGVHFSDYVENEGSHITAEHMPHGNGFSREGSYESRPSDELSRSGAFARYRTWRATIRPVEEDIHLSG